MNSILLASMGRCGTQLVKKGLTKQYKIGEHYNFYEDSQPEIKQGFIHGSHTYPKAELVLPSHTKVLFM